VDILRAAVAVVAALSIYLGYRLFCDISYQNARITRSAVLTNLLAGALLALFGLGILISDVRTIRSAAPDSLPASHKKPTKAGSFPAPKFDKHTNIFDHLA